MKQFTRGRGHCASVFAKRALAVIGTTCGLLFGAVILSTAIPTYAQTVNCTGVAAWSGNSVAYAVGNVVTYGGSEYKCIQAHTSEAGWDPPAVPALWTDEGLCATTGCITAPGAPNTPTASGTTSTSTNLAWSAVTAPAGCTISGYEVYKNGTALAAASGTTYSVTGLTAGTNYQFTVAAVDTAGTSGQSAAVSVTTTSASCTSVPGTPSTPTASGTTNTSTNLSWTAVTPPANCTITSYEVYKNGTALASTTSTTYSATGLTASTTYKFTIAAVDSDGTGAQSASVSVTTLAASCTAVPGTPATPTASGTTSSGTTLSWTAVTPPANCTISSYEIYSNGTAIGSIAGTSASITGLAASTTYKFTVAAVDSDGTGAQSAAVSVTTLAASGCTATPSAPATPAASNTTTSGTTLTWGAVTPPSGCTITGYEVYENGTALASTTSLTYNVTGLASSTTYQFTVAAVDSDGTGAKSSAVSVTTGSTGAPNFGPNVYIYNDTMSMSTIQTQINNIATAQYANQFGTPRYAFLFQPGTYSNLDLQTAYYIQVLGLGTTPDATLINGFINQNAELADSNATSNFWSGIENIAINPVDAGGTDQWAVSQACPMRRVHMKGGINLAQGGGWSSGGFLGDTQIDGNIESSSQQQWLSRNDSWGSWSGGVWNMVFVGDPEAPAQDFAVPYLAPDVDTTIAETPVIREKPFLTYSNGTYSVFVPSLRTNASGTTWYNGPTEAGTSLPISDFYIAQSATDNASTINAALASGKDILLTPGIYALGGTIQVNNPNTVILGLGMATLQANTGANAIQIADVDGVTLAGVLIESASNVNTLVQVGPSGSSASHSANPTLLADVFLRIGGDVNGQVQTGMVINSSNVIGDDFWIWRADHGNTGTVGWTTNTATNGLIVNGQNVTLYGLAVEHFQQYQTQFNANGASVYFYQSEAPYDPPTQSAWMGPGGVDGWSSYEVASTVTSHKAYGIGIYCYFNVNTAIVLSNAITAPNVSGVTFTDMVDVSLGGIGTISNIIANTGGAVNATTEVVTMDSAH